MKNVAWSLGVLFGFSALAGMSTPAFSAEGASGRPIMETHIHIYQVTRPGGVPWPPKEAVPLYKDNLPPAYEEMAKKFGVIGAGIVEASPIFEDNLKILEMTKKDKFFKTLVANLEIGSPDFVKHLEILAKDPRVVGIRGFLWAPKITLDEKQVSDLEELAKRGMTLDIISRGTLNPKDQVVALAQKVPDLRIIIDHLAGAKGEKPDPKWVADIKKVAENKNVYIKFSSFFDMFNASGDETKPWKAPLDVAAYKPHFDVLFDAFGADRMIFGSNYPVVELGGGFAKEIEIAEAYLKPLGTETRDKVMYKNAEKFYHRQVPKGAAGGAHKRGKKH